jgi:hypothetical protein
LNRKLIVCLISLIFFITIFSTCKAYYNQNNYDKIILAENLDSIEVIDQQQTSSCGLGCPFFGYLWLGQGFIPSLDTLIKVEVKLFKGGNPTSPVTLSIRNSLTGVDLTSASIDGTLVETYGKWFEFDFPDISVTPGTEYFIICRSSGGSIFNYFCAEFNINNPYDGGEAWGSIDYGANWGLIEDYYPEYPDPDACFKTYGLDDSPSKPSINGDTNGMVGKEYTYTFLSTDPEGHDLFYYVKWGDDTNSGWVGEYESGETATLKHIWQTQGTFIIQAKAKDIYGAESDWTEFTVTIPRNKAINNLFLIFLQSHHNLFPLLQKLIQT